MSSPNGGAGWRLCERGERTSCHELRGGEGCQRSSMTAHSASLSGLWAQGGSASAGEMRLTGEADEDEEDLTGCGRVPWVSAVTASEVRGPEPAHRGRGGRCRSGRVGLHEDEMRSVSEVGACGRRARGGRAAAERTHLP